MKRKWVLKDNAFIVEHYPKQMLKRKERKKTEPLERDWKGNRFQRRSPEGLISYVSTPHFVTLASYNNNFDCDLEKC